jgi:ABC-type nitrate/sulfonate/bicarbonate transport system substrate-binding protein
VRVTVTDVVSPSYFVLTAAVELGYLAAEGLAAEFILPPREASQELRDGALDLYGGSPYVGLMAFPEWRGGKLLCALSQGAYWTLAIRADLGVKRGDVDAIKGRRILAGGGPAIALKRILAEAGIDLERDGVQIVAPPWPPEPNANQARLGARAIEEGLADAFWGNSMRAEWAMRKGLATVLLDIRQGDGPPAARRYTFPAVMASQRFVDEQPAAAAAVVRGVVKAQRALKADPSLAAKAAQRLFPPEEAGLIADLVARDAPFYDPTISEDAVAGIADFAQAVGLISAPIRYEDVVATGLSHLWAE